MQLEDSIEIIGSEILGENSDLINKIDYWTNLLNIHNGWHYDLDFTWILTKIQQLDLKKGAWIADAGAGNGLIQFLLASLGYNVLSLDFADRKFPPVSTGIFDMQNENYLDNLKEHRYQKFIDHKAHSPINLNNTFKAVRYPVKLINYLKGRYGYLLNKNYWAEKKDKENNGYGIIKYVSINFKDMEKIDSESIDCLVSVSAIEHNDHEDIKVAISEFGRVLKKNASMLITTSAAKNKDWYFKECEGWCFSVESLKDIFGIADCYHNYDRYEELKLALEENTTIKNRVSEVYFKSGENSLPWGEYKPRFQPVGIIKTKK